MQLNQTRLPVYSGDERTAFCNDEGMKHYPAEGQDQGTWILHVALLANSSTIIYAMLRTAQHPSTAAEELHRLRCALRRNLRRTRPATLMMSMMRGR
jgi:hypothetical protein